MEKSIQKLLDKLGKKGFDTEKKVNAIDMQVAYDSGLADELGGILALQKAIKSHSTYTLLDQQHGRQWTEPDLSPGTDR